MAKQMVIARFVQVLEVFVNRYTPKGASEEKVYRTAYGFQTAEATGDRPRFLEIQLNNDDEVTNLGKLMNKKTDLVLEETSFGKNSEPRYSFFCTFDEMAKSTAPARVDK